MNRRIAAVRRLFEYAVTSGVRVDNPVPAARRSSGLRAKRRGLLGHAASGRSGAGGRLVREPRRLPESLDRKEISGFLADLGTYRDRAMVLLMALGGLRAAEVRGLRLADVEMGLRRVRVLGKGGRERVVPVDRLLRRAGRLPSRGTTTGLRYAGVLCGAAWSERGWAVDRGWDAPDLPHSPGPFGGGAGSPAPAAAQLRHRARRRGDRPAGPS